MNYSDYSTEQIVSPMFGKVASKIIELSKDEETRIKLERNII